MLSEPRGCVGFRGAHTSTPPCWGTPPPVRHFHRCFPPPSLAPRPLGAPNAGPERHGGRTFVHCSATWSLGPLGDRSSRYVSFTADLRGLPALLPDPNRSQPRAYVGLHPPDRVGDQTRQRAEAGETTPPRGPAPSGGADRVLTDRMMSSRGWAGVQVPHALHALCTLLSPSSVTLE